MNLKNYLPEKQIEKEVPISNYKLRQHRSELGAFRLGQKWWYRSDKVNELFNTVLEPTDDVDLNEYAVCADIYSVWPYSREMLSALGRSGKFDRKKVNGVWMYSKPDISSYLSATETQNMVAFNEAWQETENGTKYASFDAWRKALEKF